MQLEIMGARVEFTESGCGVRSALLLHGWGCSAQLMESVQRALEGSMHVVAPDFPGHGRNGAALPPPQPWGVPEYAAATLDVLRQLDFLPCAVIAHSFGGRVAAYLASEDTGLFTRIVLTGAAGIRPPQTEEGRKRSERFRQLKNLCEGARKARIFGKLPDLMEEKLRQKYGSRDYNALDGEMRKTFVKVISLDLSDRYARIQQPTLLIWGERDTETPLWMGQRMERDIPDAGLVVLEGGTHFAYLEQAQRFCAIARHFLLEE